MEANPHPSSPRRRRWILLLVLAPLPLAAIGAGWQVLSWPRVAELARHNPETTAFIERYRRQAERADRPPPRWHPVPYGRISDHLKQAVLVAEDIDFFTHRGFAWGEVQRAVLLPLGQSRTDRRKNGDFDPALDPPPVPCACFGASSGASAGVRRAR